MSDTYIGSGQIYLRRKDNTGGAIPIGDAGELKFNIETESKELQAHTSPGGGLLDKIDRIKSVTFDLLIYSLSAQNIANALYGSVKTEAAGTVTGEAHKLFKGSYIIPKKVIDIAQTITLSVGGTALTAGTDYEVTEVGIKILEGGSVTDGADATLDYSAKKQNVIEALVNSGYEFEMLFQGYNEANQAKRVNVIVHRSKFEPANELGFISDDFASLSVKGSALKDATIVAVGKSQFFKTIMQD